MTMHPGNANPDLGAQVHNMKDIAKVICLFVILLVALIIAVTCACSCNADMPKQPIIEASINTTTNVYEITSVEREMLARLVYREGNTESVECQRAIVSVVFNRLASGYWGDTLEEVVYAENQFAPANLLYCTTPTETNYEAIDYVLKNGVTVPEYVMYFRANYHFNWTGYQGYKKIDHTYFGYMTKDKENMK